MSTTYFVVAGVPVEVFDSFSREPSQNLFGEPGALVALPLTTSPYNSLKYSDGYVDSLFDKLCDELTPRLRGHPRVQCQIMLVYINYAGRELLLQRFFPISLNVAISDPGFTRRASRKQRFAQKNALIQSIRQVAQHTRDHRGVLGREIVSARSITPLLLPLRNFRSSMFRNFLFSFANKFCQEPNAQSALKTARITFEREHPRITIDGDQRKYFQDARGLIFKAPASSDLHGQPRHFDEDGHWRSCLVRGRIRLGGAYEPEFHYDCSYASERVTGDFSNCHDQLLKVAKRTHVNIAPNDWVR